MDFAIAGFCFLCVLFCFSVYVNVRKERDEIMRLNKKVLGFVETILEESKKQMEELEEILKEAKDEEPD